MAHWFKVTMLYILPHHLLSRIVQWGARWQKLPLRRAITHWYIHNYNVNMSEALEPDPDTYPNFNSFFTRSLRPEARPVAHGEGLVCSPGDGSISQLGDIHGDGIFQAKGHTYSLKELLGGSEERVCSFIDGQFLTMYLSPGDYHRIHIPLTGRLVETVYIPGRLFSVAPDYTESVPRLFARNERVICLFQTEAGLMAVVLVGAIFVGSIETTWAGEITPPRHSEIRIIDYATSESVIELVRGEELGRFNMGGSTIIVLFGPGRMQWQSGLGPEKRVKFGQALGHMAQTAI